MDSKTIASSVSATFVSNAKGTMPVLTEIVLTRRKKTCIFWKLTVSHTLMKTP